MKYMLMIVGPETGWNEEITPRPDARGHGRMGRLHAEPWSGPARSWPARACSPARRRRPCCARRATSAWSRDGPFAETKEQVGGFYLIDCANLDEALEWAKKIPAPRRPRRGPAGHGLRAARGSRSPPSAGAAVVDGLRPASTACSGDESGRAVATLIRVLGDFDLAEEAVQEAFVTALERWPRDGVPRRPGARGSRASRATSAIDRIRRERTLAEKRELLERLEALAARPDAGRAPDADGASRRPAAADLHVLPPGAGARGAGGAHPADARRA